MSEAAVDAFGLVGAVLDGKYEVSSVVAEGGFGVVYRATHLGLAKAVALKVLKVPAELAAAPRKAFLEKFQQEARLIAALEHPAIVRVLDFGASPMPVGEAAPWMVLEWLEGRTLEAQLEAHGGRGVSPPQVLEMLAPVFAAIGLAHDEGISHRDLKPANLMLVQSKRGELALKVLDFGIAKFSNDDERVAGSGSGATRTSSALVTFSLQYAAPEQLTGMRTGAWTDVHALALIVVEMLTGRAPLEGNDMSELYAAALSPMRPTPWAKGVDVGAWEPVLARALAFKPADRFASAAVLFDALRSALPGALWQPAAVRASQMPSYAPPMMTPPTGAPLVPTTLRGTEVAFAAGGSSRRWPLAVAVASVAVIAVVALVVFAGGNHDTHSAVTATPIATPPAAAPAVAPPAVVVPVAAPAPMAPAVARVDASVAPVAARGLSRRGEAVRGPRAQRAPMMVLPGPSAPSTQQVVPIE